MARNFLASFLVLTLLASPVSAAGKVTLDNLLLQMRSLPLLAEFPDPPYVTRQFSSYERASDNRKNERWFANHDRGFMLYDGSLKEKTPYFKTGPTQGRGPDGYFAAGTKVGIASNRKPIGTYVWAYATAPDGGPIEGQIPQGYVDQKAIAMDPQGHVLAEMDGPGCVVRLWSANPADAGKIRIFLDGAKEPALEAPMQELLSGKWKTKIGDGERTPFPEPLAHEVARGFNLYFPIAYQKRCKITVEKPDIYYHVDYRTYPKGTEVETFALEKLVKEEEEIKVVVETLQGKYPANAPGEGHTLKSSLEPGGKSESLSLKGPGQMRQLLVRVREAKNEAEALRGLVLIGSFDGAAKPQIWCPLGDFFGSAPGFNPYQSMPLGMAQEKGVLSLRASWSMPFAQSAELAIHNLGKQTVTVEVEVLSSTYQWTERSMHFHARWRTADLKTRPFRDWTYCNLQGKGVFVGDALSVMNPVPAWWGEGDEKIYVDGESFPSWFGTGTEDYYGYAWSDSTPFQHAYHNQTRCDGQGSGGSFGLTSVNRFHVLDAIPFTKSFRFDMEVWHWTPNVMVNYAATSYWYARPGASDDFEPVDAKVLQTIPAPPPPQKVEGAIEGETMKILKKSSDFPLGPQPMREFPDGKWSGDAQLWARPPRKGEWADLALPVSTDGKYRVFVYLTKARDYGEVQLYLNGKPLGKPIDGFHPDKVVNTAAIDLGTVELKRGAAILRIEVVGTNDKSSGLRFMWGLDCVVLKPVK